MTVPFLCSVFLTTILEDNFFSSFLDDCSFIGFIMYNELKRSGGGKNGK